MGPRDPRERPGVAPLLLLGAGEEGQGVVAAGLVEAQHLVEPAQAELVGIERVRVAGADAGALLVIDLDHQPGGKLDGHLRLDVEDVLEVAVVDLAPQHALGRGVDQVDVEPHALEARGAVRPA